MALIPVILTSHLNRIKIRKEILEWRKHLQTTGYLSEQDGEHVSVDGAPLSLELKSYLTQTILNRDIYMIQGGKYN